MADEHREMMRRQIAGKQRRMGPAYRSAFSDAVSGHVNRYSLVFKTEGRFTDNDSQQTGSLMATFGAGTISDAELD
jgi:hypothetical protein